MIWKSRLFSQFEDLIHGSTSKSYGALRFSESADKEEVVRNREKLLAELAVNPSKTFLMHQVHDKGVFVVTNKEKGNVFQTNDLLPEADAMITNQPGVTLIVRTADCVPVLVYDPKQKVISVIHAGWKGTSKNIVQEVVTRMKNEYNSSSSDLFAVIGPSICGQCYDNSRVEDNRVEIFQKLYSSDQEVVRKLDGHIKLDLPRANYLQLIEAGITPAQIEASPICTFEDGNWASYRARPQDLQYPIWSFLVLRPL